MGEQLHHRGYAHQTSGDGPGESRLREEEPGLGSHDGFLSARGRAGYQGAAWGVMGRVLSAGVDPGLSGAGTWG